MKRIITFFGWFFILTLIGGFISISSGWLDINRLLKNFSSLYLPTLPPKNISELKGKLPQTLVKEKTRAGERNRLSPPDWDRYQLALSLSFNEDPQFLNYQAASQIFTQLIKNHPGFAEAHRGLARCEALFLKDPAKAIKSLQRAVSLDPEYREALYELARFSLIEGDFSRAADYLQHSLNLGGEDPDNLRSQPALAGLLKKENPSDHPGTGGSHNHLTHEKNSKNPPELSPELFLSSPEKFLTPPYLKEWNRIYPPFPKDSKNDFIKGFLSVFSGSNEDRNYPLGKEIFGELIKKHPEQAVLYRALGYAVFNLGFQVEPARIAYQKALELDPDYGEVHYAMAFLLAGTGNVLDGKIHFDKSRQLGIEDSRNLGKKFFGF